MKNSPATKRLVGFAGRQVRTPEDSPAVDDDDDDNFDSSPELSLSKRSSAELLDPSSPSTALPPAAPPPAAELDPPSSTTLPPPVAPPSPIAALAAERKPSLPFRSSSSPGAYGRLAADGKQSLLSPSEARSDGAAPRPRPLAHQITRKMSAFFPGLTHEDSLHEPSLRAVIPEALTTFELPGNKLKLDPIPKDNATLRPRNGARFDGYDTSNDAGEAVVTIDGYDYETRTSPLCAINLSRSARTRASISEKAHFFAFVYPIPADDWRRHEKEVMGSRVGEAADEELDTDALLKYGGFAYFNSKGDHVSLNAVRSEDSLGRPPPQPQVRHARPRPPPRR